MVLTSRTQNLLADLQKIMALDEDEFVQRGMPKQLPIESSSYVIVWVS